MTGKQAITVKIWGFFIGVILLLASPSAFSNFGPEIRLTAIKGPSVFPRLAAAGGMLHVAWMEYVNAGVDPEIYYTRSPDGATWMVPVNLSNASGRPDMLPLVAAAGNYVYVAWTSDPTNGEVYFRRSADGGATWQPAVQLSASANGYSRATDLRVDRSGNLHLVYYDDRGGIFYGQIFHRMSCDNGQSWTPERNLTQYDGVVDNEYPRIGQLPSGALYLIFRSTRAGRPQGGWPPATLFGVRSRSVGCPGGANWFYPAQELSPVYPKEFASVYSPTLLTLRDGRLALTYWDRKRGNNVTFRRGAPESRGWEASLELTNFPLSQPEAGVNAEGIAPSLAEAPGGSLYATFQQTTGTIEGFSTGPVLYLSSGNGVNWSSPVRAVSHDGTMHPYMVADNGRLHFIWADFRNTASGSFGSEIYYRYFTLAFFTGITNLIEHYYRAILNRASDAGGLAFWQSEISRLQALGVDIQEVFRVMAGWFFTSPEYLSRNTNDSQYVTDLYRTFFNRSPDSSGLNFWTGQLALGMPRSIVLFSFLFSPEFGSYMRASLGDTGSRGEVYGVVDFYRGFLNRLPDTGGFNYWITRFRTAQCQGAASVNAEVNSISTQFLSSAEYIGRNRTHRDYVADLYYAFLRRGGELSGFNYWVSQLTSGTLSREQVRISFFRSPEFQNRVREIINGGCL